MSSRVQRIAMGLAVPVLLGLACGVGCTGPDVAPIPAFADGGLLRLGTPLTQASHELLEGRFTVVQGKDLLGGDVVLTTGKNTITLSSGKEAGVVALQAACLTGDRLIMEGHWRRPRGSPTPPQRATCATTRSPRPTCTSKASGAKAATRWRARSSCASRLR